MRVISVEYVRQPGENKITLLHRAVLKSASVPVFTVPRSAVWERVNAGFKKGTFETHGTVLSVSPH